MTSPSLTLAEPISSLLMWSDVGTSFQLCLRTPLKELVFTGCLQGRQALHLARFGCQLMSFSLGLSVLVCKMGWE